MTTNIRPGCAYYARCREFFESLRINDRDQFDPEWDMCYCQKCHEGRGDKEVYTRGNPPKTYGIPIGWVRLALKEPAEAKAKKAGENWHRAFHGTSISCIQPILDSTRLVAAGRHLESRHDEEGREDRHVYLSPSIQYAGYYGDSETIQLKNRRYYRTRVAFYTLINPTSYKIRPGKIRDPRQKDNNFPLSELDWYTDKAEENYLYGIMVHMEKL